MRNKKQHIDDAQAATVDEHFEFLFNDDSSIDSEHKDANFDDLPEWYNEELFRAGQRYYQRNLLSMGLVSFIGLLAVIVIPSILKVLVSTKQSGTVCSAYKRYLQTLLHVYTLYTTDINDRNSDWWKSLNTIRWKHATGSRISMKADGYGITHRDMALTQFGFIGYALISAEHVSLTNEPEGVEGLVHFWRVVGWALGISDRANICRKNVKETRELCQRLLNDVYAKHMKDPGNDFRHMSSVLIDGMWSVDFTLDNDAIMVLWYKLSGLRYDKPISVYSLLNSWYRSIVLYLLGVPFVGLILRNGFNVFLRISYWLARYVPVVAWLRHGKDMPRIEMCPKFTKSS